MNNVWHQIKGWVAVVTAFIACPCHLPITHAKAGGVLISKRGYTVSL